MRLNDKGFSGIVDACIFIIILMLAVPFIIHHGMDQVVSDDAEDMMDTVSATMVRMDSVTDSDIGDIMDVPDLLAYSLATGDGGPIRFVEDIIGSRSPGHAYRLELTMGDLGMVVGEGGGTPISSSTRTFNVSVGGEITIDIRIF